VGKYLLDATNAGGVDVSRLIVSSEFPSASYLAVVDHNGNPVLSIDDMHIMELVTPKHIYANRKWITRASMVVLDGNLSPASIKSAVSVAAKASVPVCVDPASVALSPRVSPHLSQLFMVVPNQAEAEALSGVPSSDSDQATAAAQRLVSMGVNTAVITLAEKGLVYATSEETGRVPAMQVEVTDPTGGGDALTGALVFGLVNGFSVSEAARLGVSAAALTLSSTDTVCPDLSLERLYDQLMI
jgi:pseudouridine kinase